LCFGDRVAVLNVNYFEYGGSIGQGSMQLVIVQPIYKLMPRSEYKFPLKKTYFVQRSMVISTRCYIKVYKLTVNKCCWLTILDCPILFWII